MHTIWEGFKYIQVVCISGIQGPGSFPKTNSKVFNQAFSEDFLIAAILLYPNFEKYRNNHSCAESNTADKTMINQENTQISYDLFCCDSSVNISLICNVSPQDTSLSLKKGSRREVMLGRQEEIKPQRQPGQYYSFPSTTLFNGNELFSCVPRQGANA